MLIDLTGKIENFNRQFAACGASPIRGGHARPTTAFDLRAAAADAPAEIRR